MLGGAAPAGFKLRQTPFVKGKNVMTKLAISTAMMAAMIMPHLQAESCSNADLRGEYSFSASGTLNGAPFVAAGQTVYNGDGTASGVIQVSALGAVGPATTWTAKYSVTAIVTGGGQNVCVLTKTIVIKDGPTVSFFGTAGADFKELRFIATAFNGATANLAISGTARKQ
jgi:hypothetical protein